MASKKFLTLKILFALGMLISLYLLYEHLSPAASEFCNFGASFDCGIVNKSPYANLDGISYLLTIDFRLPFLLVNFSGMNSFFDIITSNAFLGFLTLLFLFGLVDAFEKGRKFLWVEKNRALAWMKGITAFGVFYGLYLVYIQHFILKTYCIFCLALDAVLITSLAIILKMKN